MCQELCTPIEKTRCTDHHRRREMFVCYAWVVECWVTGKKKKQCILFWIVIFSTDEKSEEKKFYLGPNFVTGKTFP